MVYIDTNILIYLLENHPKYGKEVADTMTEYKDQGHEFVSSVVTITEFLSGTEGSNAAVLQEVALLKFIDFTEATAAEAATLVRDSGANIGDAIHLATALSSHAEVFLTNDAKLAKLARKHIEVKTLGKEL